MVSPTSFHVHINGVVCEALCRVHVHRHLRWATPRGKVQATCSSCSMRSVVWPSGWCAATPGRPSSSTDTVPSLTSSPSGTLTYRSLTLKVRSLPFMCLLKLILCKSFPVYLLHTYDAPCFHINVVNFLFQGRHWRFQRCRLSLSSRVDGLHVEWWQVADGHIKFTISPNVRIMYFNCTVEPR